MSTIYSHTHFVHAILPCAFVYNGIDGESWICDYIVGYKMDINVVGGLRVGLYSDHLAVKLN